MFANVLVMTSTFWLHPDADGRFSFAGVPPGTYHAVAWFPYGDAERTEVTVEADKPTTLDFHLRERRNAGDHRNKLDKPYTRY
jgi:carboxypeptidase family protein